MKRQIIEKLTDAMVSIEGENLRGVTWVKGTEVTSGDWGVGGQPLTTEALRSLVAGLRLRRKPIVVGSRAGLAVPPPDVVSAARG